MSEDNKKEKVEIPKHWMEELSSFDRAKDSMLNVNLAMLAFANSPVMMRLNEFKEQYNEMRLRIDEVMKPFALANSIMDSRISSIFAELSPSVTAVSSVIESMKMPPSIIQALDSLSSMNEQLETMKFPTRASVLPPARETRIDVNPALLEKIKDQQEEIEELRRLVALLKGDDDPDYIA